MSKKTYDNSIINDFPAGFSMELPDGYRIDTEYDDDWNQIAHLRGGFYTNDEGDEDFAFTGSFLTLNVDLKVKEDADPQTRANLHNPAHPDFAFNQVMESVKGNFEEQHGEGKCLKLYKSRPYSAIMKFYQPFTLFGVTLDTYVVFYWVEVNENTVFGFTSVYRNDQDEAGEYHKHLLKVIKSVRVNGNPVDTGKLTPKKLEKALDLDANEDADSLDLGLSIGINFKNGDEETNYTLNSDGSISEEKVNTGLEYTSPDESLYPHYNSMLRSQGLGMLGMFGVNVVVNQTGTEYKFYSLEDDLDEDASDEMKDAVSKLNDTGSSKYTLADRAKEMMPVFHVAPEVFDTEHDRECELQEGMMHRAYMMSALRSFAWTMAKYCNALNRKPQDLTLDQIQNIIDTCSDTNWLNYDNKSVCKGLCGTQDLHVYYLPDKTPESVKAVFMPSQEVLDQTKQMQEKFPNYNPILSQIGSLDKLREDLEYIHPAIEKIYEDLKANRNYNEALTGNDADILYAWCALSYAARGPFFTEDGPTSCWFTQTISEEERRIASEKERKELCEKWLADNGQYLEKNPKIEFSGKKFVFTGLAYRNFSMNDETDYHKLIEDRGGLTRKSVSGVTDYLVVEPAGAGEAKIQAMLENQKNGKPAKIILIDDLRRALGLQDLESDTATAAHAAPVHTSTTEETAQVSEETVIVDGSWAILVPAGFKYCTDKNIIGNHRNIIIMEDKPDNDFEDPFSASISFTSMFNENENENMDGVAMAKMMIGFMGVKDNKVAKDDQDLYVSYYYEPDRSYKEAGEKLDVHHIKVGTVKGVSSIQVFFSNSPLSRREQTKLVEKVAKSIRLSKPGELNEKHLVPVSKGKTEEVSKPNRAAANPFGQPKKIIGNWSFKTANTSKIKTQLLNNDKGIAARILSIAEVNKAENLQQIEQDFRELMTACYPDFHETMETILPLADKYSSLFIDANGVNLLEEGKLINTLPIHSLRSFVWTATNLNKKKAKKDFPVEAPEEMWIELARFIQSKGCVNYKHCKPEAAVYGNVLFRSKEVGLIYTSDNFTYDEALVENLQSADRGDLFELVSILNETSPVMELYYKQITDSNDSETEGIEAMRCILQGWTAFAYACRTPFCVVQKSSYKGDHNGKNKPAWTEKYETTDYEGGKFIAIGTSLIEVKDHNEILRIPEGITDINRGKVNRKQWNLEFAKKVIYPTTFTGCVVIPSNAEEVEILGDFDALEIRAYDPEANLPELRRVVCSGTANSLPDHFAIAIMKANNLKEIIFPEGLKEITITNLTCNNIEVVQLPESLERIEEFKIDDASGIIGEDYPTTTFIVYRSCKVLDYMKRQFEAEKREITEWNKSFGDNPNLVEHYAFRIQVIDAPWIVKAQTFVREISKLYEKSTAEGAETEAERIVKSAFTIGRDFRLSKDCILKEAKKAGLYSFAEIIKNANDIDNRAVAIAEDIKNTIEARIQKEKEKEREEEEKRRVEIMKLSQSETITDLEKVINLLRTYYSESSEAEQLMKRCTEKINSIKADKYARAITFAEEDNENSLLTALSLLKGITPFEDSEDRITAYQKKLEDEKAYNRAVSMMTGADIADLRTVRDTFERLGEYKDSAIKAAACERYLYELCERKYQEAKDAQAVCTVESQTLAIVAYNRLENYKDAAERSADCASNIKVIKEMLGLEEQLKKHNEELKLLTGFFKRRQRREQEEMIRKLENQVNELRSQLKGIN